MLADYVLEHGATGWTVLSECRRLQPDARVGMISALPLRLPRGQGCPFLQKPFEQKSCAEFVGRLLDAGGLRGPEIRASNGEARR